MSIFMLPRIGVPIPGSLRVIVYSVGSSDPPPPPSSFFLQPATNATRPPRRRLRKWREFMLGLLRVRDDILFFRLGVFEGGVEFDLEGPVRTFAFEVGLH